MGTHRLRPRGAGQPRPDTAARPARPPARRRRRCAGARRRTARPHFQPRSWDPSVNARRTRPGARTVRPPTDETTTVKSARSTYERSTYALINASHWRSPDGARHTLVDGRDAGVS